MTIRGSEPRTNRYRQRRVVLFGASQTSLEQFHYYAVVLRVTGGAAGSVLTSLTIGGVEVLIRPVEWATSNNNTADLLQAAIGANGWVGQDGGTNFVLAAGPPQGGSNGPNAGYWGQGGPVVRGVATGTFQVSVLEGHSDRGWFGWFNALAGMPFTVVNNAGISGSDIADVTRRADAALVGFDADIAVVEVLGRTIPPNASSAFALWKKLIEKLRRYGLRIVVVGAPPGLPGILTSAQGSAEICKFGRLIAQFCQNDPEGDIEFYQTGLSMVDPASAAGDLFANLHGNDTIHQNSAGGYTMGRDLFNAWGKFLPSPRQLVHSKVDEPVSSPTSLQRMPAGLGLFQGTGGTLDTESTGSLATAWTDITVGGTNVYSKAARTFAVDGDNIGDNQICTHTNSGGSDFVQFATTSSFHGNFGIGDSIYADAEVAYTLTSGVGLRNVALVLTVVEGPIAHIMHAGGSWGGLFGTGNDNVALPESFKITRRTPIVENLPVAPSLVTLGVQMWSHAAAGVSAVKVGRAAVWKVEN